MRKTLSRFRRAPAVVEERTVQHLIQENVLVNELLQQQAEQGLTTLHRPLEQAGVLLGRPVFVFSFLAVLIFWIAGNLWVKARGLPAWDEPPFYWLQGVMTLLSLLVTTTVLVAQARQGQITEQRSQLILQVVMLTEQRTAKIIALNEELRQDLPNVEDRVDPEAQVMAQASDPVAIMEALTIMNEGGDTSLPPTSAS